ncbi:hypothetical protein BRADI_1g55452v3 [Brachypodium distachyon]|uniref:Uncharacterized protein n=1 Tax=Brachypodium distachyon TaxID=15368 RepID=A0A2K2DRJ4_BRADI|nr:hypothetical protein BRADI_1g55452v3 [Brachypodium distachyon]
MVAGRGPPAADRPDHIDVALLHPTLFPRRIVPPPSARSAQPSSSGGGPPAARFKILPNCLGFSLHMSDTIQC